MPKLFGKKVNLAIVGATGAVGCEMLTTVIQRKFPVREIRLFASKRSKGRSMETPMGKLEVEELTGDSFAGRDIQIALFSAGSSPSRKYAPLAAKAGTIVIDNSSAFRMDDKVPLVVPEVNPKDVEKHNNIIANPNCSTIQMVLALKPIHDAVTVKRVVVSTYQAVSGAGLQALAELREQTEAVLRNEKELKIEKFPHQIAFNAIPQIDVFLENAYTKEEMKMVWETRKIMHDDSIRVTATCVRIPVFRGHAESVNIETEKKIPVQKVRALIQKARGIRVMDDVKRSCYPLPADAAEKDLAFVGRIREDESVRNGINMWIVADNLRKGAALNAVQIAELL